MNVIEIEHVHKLYHRKGSTVGAVKDLSIVIDEGEVFGFLGPNGAGKSTTIKMIMGLIKPSSGAIRIMGIGSESYASRRHIGYLPENPALYDYLTAVEYLVFVGKIYGLSNSRIQDRSQLLLQLLELWDARNRPIRSYSKGMVQRLGLAQALIHDPSVLILDEPMSGLDPIGRALVKDIILDLKKKNKCVFFSTHITADVESVCNRVGIITNGVLRRVESVDTILDKGIIGYRVRVKAKGTDTQQEYEITKSELSRFLASVQNNGKEVVLIEPRRNNLEEFFLSIVKG